MMEWLIVAAIALFGGWQYDRANDLEKELEETQHQALQNYMDYQNAVKVGNENADLVIESGIELEICVGDLQDATRIRASLEQDKENLSADIAVLAENLNTTDWGRVRIPDSVDF